MSIRDHLRQGEAIISDHNPFYATSHRVIHYEERDGNEELRELPLFSADLGGGDQAGPAQD